MTIVSSEIPATSGSPAARASESPRRILAVARLHLVNRAQILYTPLIVLAGIFLVNLSIWWIIIALSGKHATHHLGYSGAVSYIFIYMMVVAVQAIARTFPFSLGYGVTRRDFYLGSAAAFVLLSIFFAAVLTIMSSIEVATGGWGVQGRMFAPLYFTNPSWLIRFVMYLLVFLFFLFIGSAAASAFVRWRALGLTVFFGAITVVLVGLAALLTITNSWVGFADILFAGGPFGVVLWTLVPTAIAAVAGFFLLRRATPKN
jgi:hypothetical protein